MQIQRVVSNLKRPDEIVDYPVIRMALDIRLACLLAAVKEEWEDLQVDEMDGALVIRIRRPEAMGGISLTPALKQISKLRSPAPLPSD